MSKLPKKPSELVTLALNDLEAVEKNEKYAVRMSSWHVPMAIAGAVMANTLKISELTAGGPCIVGDANDAKALRALNEFREGHINKGLIYMGLDGDFKFRDIPGYMYDKTGFKSAMKQLVKDFEEVGL